MHTIEKLMRPRRPNPHYMGFYAVYHDGPHIRGRCLAADPITAYHGAVLAALRMFELNQRLNPQRT